MHLFNFKAWHVLGLMYRHEKNYEEAIKCYKSALRFDKENFQILRDLSLLQLQTRQLESLLETRQRILLLRPAAPLNWISLAVAYHVADQQETALEIMDIYLDTFCSSIDDCTEAKYYMASLMEELESWSAAKSFMENQFGTARLTVKFLEIYGFICFKMQNYEEALKVYKQLFKNNTENRSYIRSLVEITEINGGSIKDLMEKCKSECESDSDSDSIFTTILFLESANLDEFRLLFKDILDRVICEGGSNGFRLFQSFMDNPDKQKLITEHIDFTIERAKDDKIKLSALNFNIRLQIEMKRHDLALSNIVEALKINPQDSELLRQKAKIFKECGELSKSIDCLKFCCELDPNDKFVNCELSSAMIQDGNFSAAQLLMSKFIHKPTFSSKIQDLHDIQTLWYLQEMGRRLFVDEKFIFSAAFFKKVEMIFSDFVDDQFDFHSYALRRMNLVEYVKFLRFEDKTLLKDKIFREALIYQIRCYLEIRKKAKDNDLSYQLSNLTLSNKLFEEELTEETSRVKRICSSEALLVQECQKLMKILFRYHSEELEVLELGFKLGLELGSFLVCKKIKKAVSSDEFDGKSEFDEEGEFDGKFRELVARKSNEFESCESLKGILEP